MADQRDDVTFTAQARSDEQADVAAEVWIPLGIRRCVERAHKRTMRDASVYAERAVAGLLADMRKAGCL